MNVFSFFNADRRNTTGQTASDMSADYDETWIDIKSYNTPQTALSACHYNIIQMTGIVRYSITLTIELLHLYNNAKMQELISNNLKICSFKSSLENCFVKLKEIYRYDDAEIDNMMCIMSDFWNIGSYALRLSTNYKIDSDTKLPPAMYNLLDALCEITDFTVDAYVEDNIHIAEKILPLKKVICTLCHKLRAAPDYNTYYDKALTYILRISFYCYNISMRIKDTPCNQDIKQQVDNFYEFTIKYMIGI